MTPGQSTARFAPPPPDVVVAVPVVAVPVVAVQGVAFSKGSPEARFEPPPPDVMPDVPLATAQRWPPPSRAQGDGASAGHPEVRFAPPPPDVVADVPLASGPGYAAAYGAAPDGTNGSGTYEHTALAPASVALDNQEAYRIVRAVAEAHSGADRYQAVRTDRPGEGLAFGLVLFSQASGLLGAVLEAMHRRDPVRFTEGFGPASAQLLAVTNGPTEHERMQRVEGRPLTDAFWAARFRQAGAVEAFHAAQNEVAIERQFRPMVAAARALGLGTDRELAFAYEAVVSRGLDTARAWLAAALGPVGAGASAAARLDALVAAAEGPMRERLARLRHSAALYDVPVHDA